MARRRERLVANPLLKDRVSAIVGPPLGEETPAVTQAAAVSMKAPPERATRDAERTRKGRATVQIKARFSAEEAAQVDRFARTLSSYLRATVKGSEVTRALWSLAIRAEDELAQIVSKAPRMDRPSYGDKLAMADYEDAIADFLLLALKQTNRR